MRESLPVRCFKNLSFILRSRGTISVAGERKWLVCCLKEASPCDPERMPQELTGRPRHRTTDQIKQAQAPAPRARCHVDPSPEVQFL